MSLNKDSKYNNKEIIKKFKRAGKIAIAFCGVLIITSFAVFGIRSTVQPDETESRIENSPDKEALKQYQEDINWENWEDRDTKSSTTFWEDLKELGVRIASQPDERERWIEDEQNEDTETIEESLTKSSK